MIRIQDVQTGLWWSFDNCWGDERSADVFESADDCPSSIKTPHGVSLELSALSVEEGFVLYYEEEDEEGNGSLEVQAYGWVVS